MRFILILILLFVGNLFAVDSLLVIKVKSNLPDTIPEKRIEGKIFKVLIGDHYTVDPTKGGKVTITGWSLRRDVSTMGRGAAWDTVKTMKMRGVDTSIVEILMVGDTLSRSIMDFGNTTITNGLFVKR